MCRPAVSGRLPFGCSRSGRRVRFFASLSAGVRCAVVQPSLTTPVWPPIMALKPFLATSAGTTTLSPTLSLSCFLARLCQRPHLGTAMTRSRLHGGDDRAFPPLQASDPREVTVAPEVTVASTSGAGFVARAPRCRDDGSSPERAGETELPPPPLSD